MTVISAPTGLDFCISLNFFIEFQEAQIRKREEMRVAQLKKQAEDLEKARIVAENRRAIEEKMRKKQEEIQAKQAEREERKRRRMEKNTGNKILPKIWGAGKPTRPDPWKTHISHCHQSRETLESTIGK